MRKIILIVAILASWAVSPGAAQKWPQIDQYPRQQADHPHPEGPRTPALAPGDIYDATGLGAPLLLDKGWRVGITADPAASTQNFDDSQWAVRNAIENFPEIPEPKDDTATPDTGGVHVQVGPGADKLGRYVWFRIHIRLAPNHAPVALMMELPVSRSTAMSLGSGGTSISVYANGQLVTPDGPNGSNAEHYQQISRLYKLNIASTQTDLTLAIRSIYVPLGYNAYTSFFATRSFRIGYPGDLQRGLMTWNDGTLFERIPRLVYSIVLFVLAIFLFALYYAQPGHNEYLWLALHELAQAPIGFVEWAGSTAHIDSLWYAALVLELMAISAYLFFEFLVSFLGLRRRWYISLLRYSAPVLAFIGPMLLLVGHSTAIGIVLAIVMLSSAIWGTGWLFFNLATLIAATVRRNFEAGLLLIPFLLSLLGSLEPAITAGMNEVLDHPEKSPLTIFFGPIPVHLAAIADFTGVLAIIIIIFLRFLRIQEDQQRATSELAAARSVQELLIPREKAVTPGFEVDAVYNPAAEVGGDFYHVQAVGNDGVLVVIGDVAGKGLKAAMNVSMIMGALRRWTDPNPAHILTSLNRVLTGSESFTTCQAAWFGADGELVMANAGHLPPYLNSQEIAIPGGLPLGVVADVQYEEIRLYLHPGDRLLMLSDGVVEARKSSGELFGFDRVHNLSNQSAFYIAEAARDFGQIDDITVLTVRRTVQGAAERTPDVAAASQLQPATGFAS